MSDAVMDAAAEARHRFYLGHHVGASAGDGGAPLSEPEAVPEDVADGFATLAEDSWATFARARVHACVGTPLSKRAR